MDVRDTEKHERVLSVFIDKRHLEDIIERAVADKTGIAVETLRKHGELKIEPNMEGSPQYQSGYKATFRATIPIAA